MQQIDTKMADSEDDIDGIAPHSGVIYIVDHQFALNQYDFIENCQALSNFVLPDTVLKYLNRK